MYYFWLQFNPVKYSFPPMFPFNHCLLWVFRYISGIRGFECIYNVFFSFLINTNLSTQLEIDCCIYTCRFALKLPLNHSYTTTTTPGLIILYH